MPKSLTPPERETIILINDESDVATVTSWQWPVITRLEKNPLARKVEDMRYGTSVGARFELPSWSVSFRSKRRQGAPASGRPFSSVGLAVDGALELSEPPAARTPTPSLERNPLLIPANLRPPVATRDELLSLPARMKAYRAEYRTSADGMTLDLAVGVMAGDRLKFAATAADAREALSRFECKELENVILAFVASFRQAADDPDSYSDFWGE